MGDTQPYQPLTDWDKKTVVFYRSGIVGACLTLVLAALRSHGGSAASIPADVLLIALYVFIGVSVFFIHLYIGKFHRFLKMLFGVAVLGGAGIFAGFGGIEKALASPVGPLMLVPLSVCLGFITAKEAFCFRLYEGYILALLMPALLAFAGLGFVTARDVSFWLSIVATLLSIFLFRKVFQPLHYDIGDKSAYQ